MVNVTIDDLTLLAGAIQDGDFIEMDRQGAPDISRKVTKVNFVTDIDNADIAAGAGIVTSKLADAAIFVFLASTDTLTNKTLDDFSNSIEADAVHAQVRNESGSTMNQGDAVIITGF